KTTIILSLLKRLPENYKLCLLKNEFGDVEGTFLILKTHPYYFRDKDGMQVLFAMCSLLFLCYDEMATNLSVDSELARETNVDVQEMLNGCMCCVLVGQMKLALLELKAPIAWQIRQLVSEGFVLDSIVTVVDCENFTGYEDTSYTAKMQAQYTDVILLNKHELVTEHQFDIVLDHINELNTDTPKVRCDPHGSISPDLIFGLDTRLFETQYDRTHIIDELLTPGTHENEILKGDGGKHQENEVDLIQVTRRVGQGEVLQRNGFEAFLKTLPKEDVYRLKGFVRLHDDSDEGLYIINHAFGRYTFTRVKNEKTLDHTKDILVKVTVMGQGLKMYEERVKGGLLGGGDGEVKVVLAHWH
ncbi:hypothetical protein BC937DRAFT_88166, partial [Endogone sp. FLAS-F59071]